MKKILIPTLLLCTAIAHASDDKLDLMLQRAQGDSVSAKAFVGKAIATTDGGRFLQVLIRTDDADLTRDAITSIGGRVTSQAGDILVASLPPDALRDIAARDEVGFVEASKLMTSKMNTARTYTGAAALQPGGSSSLNLTGKNVIVGVVDSALDYGNSAFRGSSGTRVQFVRRVSDVSSDGTPSYQVCVKSQIDDGSCAIPANGSGDPSGHGTHVTGIAASSDSTYTGAAPAADIFFIYYDSPQDFGTDGSTSDVLTFSGAVVEGVSQFFTGADILDKAAVVNLSLGTSLGAHDNTSLMEQGLNALVGDGKPGRIIVNAAGNERVNPNVSGVGAGGIHATINNSSNGANTGYRFVVVSANSFLQAAGGVIADIWMQQGSNCTVEGRAYPASGTSTVTTNSSATVGPKPTNADASIVSSRDSKIELSLGIDGSDPNNGLSHAQLTAASVSTFTNMVYDGGTAGYFFDIVFRGTSCAGNMWLFPDSTTTTVFLQGVSGVAITGSNSYTLADGDSSKTITIPGTASGVITVGSFMQEKPLNSGVSQWTSVNGTTYQQNDPNPNAGIGNTPGGVVGAVSLFSSLGPTANPTATGPKPDVIAPGEPVIATLARAIANASSIQPEKVNSGNFKLQGTSMASPNVAGAIALILEYNNTLTAPQMKTLLRNTATAVPGGDANAVGAGKVNVLAAVNATTRNTSAYRGTGNVTTSDVNECGFVGAGTCDSGSSGGCGMLPNARPAGMGSIAWLLLLPLIALLLTKKSLTLSGHSQRSQG